MARASLLVCALLASVPSCPDLFSLATHGFTPPTVDMTTAMAFPDPAGLRVLVSFTAVNPNPYPIPVSGVDYVVALKGTPVYAGTEGSTSVPENGGKTTLTVTGVIAKNSPVFSTLVSGQAAAYTISGTAHVDSPAGVPVDVEFSDQNSFVVPSGLPFH